MYKVIDLGSVVPSTGEQRIRILDAVLTKTASTEIQEFWDSIEDDPRYAYLWVIGVSAHEYYGCNNNGDAFEEEELKKTHTDFVERAHVFMHHVNKDPRKSIGKPVYSWYNEPMHRVELILRVDRQANGAENVVRKIEAGEQLYVSMGCHVDYDVCSICGNKAPTRREYCDHLRYNMKAILDDGRQVFALNPNPKFFDISVVNRPADPTAFALDKKASEGSTFCDDVPVKLAADLGEEAELYREKLAALDKLSDMIKQVSGTVVDSKGDFSVASALREHGFEDVEYPDIPHSALRIMRVSPGGLFSLLREAGAPIGFGDALYMSGRHVFGGDFCEAHIPHIMKEIPRALALLREKPEDMEGIIRSVLSDYDGEMEHKPHRDMVVRIIRPAVELRISIHKKLAAEQPYNVEKSWADASEAFISPKGTNFASIRLSGGAKTAPYFVHQRHINATPGKILGAALGVGALCAAASAPTLADKLVYGIVLGVPAKNLLFGKSRHSGVEKTVDGKEIPATAINEVWKSTPHGEKVAGLRASTAIGMALPLALALDYGFNDWKYRNDPLARAEAESSPSAEVARFVQDNPITAVALGGGLGAILGGVLSKVSPAG